MEATILFQELANGAEIVSKLAAGVTPSEARFKPNPAS
jgi:hypothetical protein